MTASLTMAVLHSACVVGVIAYLLTRTNFYYAILEKKQTSLNRIFLIILFSAFTLYGAYNAIPFNGGLISLRPTGPILGGFLGGPWVGLAAGLVGALDRSLHGGISMQSAAWATVLSGLFAGLYHRWIKQGALVGVGEAACFTVLYEVFAAGLTFFAVPDFATALTLEKGIRIPLIVGNTIAVAIFIFITRNLLAERQTRAVKERIEGELNVARNIQMSMVPKIFPPFPGVRDFDVFASLAPAKEVGGDLYDFFFIDENHFCFLIGDVSGKGVPASLFMAVAKTLLHAKSGKGVNSDEILFNTNNDLCRENDETMFVTVFCGILDIRTGEVIFTNGGHTRPYLYKQAGIIATIACKQGIALGVMENFPFEQEKFVMGKGDTLILYTDGVTEAMSLTGEMFSEERLAKAIGKVSGHMPQEIACSIVDEIRTFSAGAEQFDDITMLILTYRGWD